MPLERRHHRKTPWRLVKKYCRAAGIDPDRLGGRGIGIHSLRKTTINDAIRNGTSLHEVRQFAGHVDIRTTDLYFVRRRRTPRWRRNFEGYRETIAAQEQVGDYNNACISAANLLRFSARIRAGVSHKQ